MPKFIAAQDRNPFGEEFDESILTDPGHDSTYIEGYSDVRRDRELALRARQPVKPLKHRLQWARAKTFDGQRADGKRIMHWQTEKKYEALSYEEAVRLGYRVDKNPAIRKGEDGLAYLGERVLMYASARVAAANLKKVQQDTRDLMEKPARDMENSVARFHQNTKGAHAVAFHYVGDQEPSK